MVEELFDIEKNIGSQIHFIRLRCKKYLHNEADSEMLLSEVLERVFKFRHKFTGSEIDFHKWVQRVVYNCFINNIRTRKPNEDKDFQDLEYKYHPSFHPDNDAYSKEMAVKIMDAIQVNFNPIYQKIFELFFIEEMKMYDISLEVNIPFGTVKTRIYRMRHFLMDKFKIENSIK